MSDRIDAARIALARLLLAGNPGTRRTRIALAKVNPGSYLAADVTWTGALRPY